ncbi:MAG: TrkH family potassium uptake protein [Thiothrix sp.]|nr:TrkH family potassium uptake protein [Thiothrix sp.]HPQ95300.1 TrkH family potassium uptake protein [Thiolinea sp.]
MFRRYFYRWRRYARNWGANLTRFNPPALLTLGFVLLIVIGAALLKLPFASHATTTWLDALFTATSAVTVTGLVVVDTGTHYTLFGQVVIALLIQVGGLGFMTFAVVGASMLGTKIGFLQQRVAQEAMNQTSLERVGQTARAVLVYSLSIESVGFVLLLLRWGPELGWLQAGWEALFYTVSAFNNAGFALNAGSLMPYAGSWLVNLVITTLFISGGIGFVVLMDVWEKRRWRFFSVNTRMVLLATLIINVVAFLLIWLLEVNNPATLGPMDWQGQVLTAWFQAVTPRTAGFNTLDIASMTNASLVLIILLMFIGGGSLSTASGLKVGTFVVLMMSTFAFLRQREEVTVLKRTVPLTQVMKALSLMMASLFLIFMGIFILDATEHTTFQKVVFEVVSAISTVGLSLGLTGELSGAGRAVVIFLMVAGRLGPLTLAYLIASPRRTHIRYADAKLQIG